ncbi:UbiA-like polyprenyltransferase [Acidiplasma sp.]|uniref:UbiA-like polyprenyltransferase n=1 Tax=Acidiplasma sp. TaxID=1872114 RepID=UPI0031686D8C
MKTKLKTLFEYVKMEHTVFDLPFIFAGALIASNGIIEMYKFFIILFVAISARGAAMSINRILGLKYDITNPRKRNWALVTGEINLRQAIAFTLILVFIFEGLTYLLNNLVFMLSPIVLIFFIADPLMKRVTSLRHLFMGFTIGLGIIGGYLAVNPNFPPAIIYLMVAGSTFWIAGFDIIYTIPDEVYDKKNGLKTIIVKYGVKKGLIISWVFHIFTIIFFIYIAFIVHSIYYILALIPIIILILYEHVAIHGTTPENVRKVFFNPNSIIGFLFLIGIYISLVA